MPLSWNEIRDRATRFAHDWADADYERGEAQMFWREFFEVFGLGRSRVYSFEKRVEKLDNKKGYIDCFWPGTLIAEHKSRGKNLDTAHQQAVDYFDGLKEHELPTHIVVSDFARIRLYELADASGQYSEFALKDFPKHVKQFGFIAGYKPQVLRPEDPVNIKAAEKMGRLHDMLRDSGYEGHPLEVLLVRLLFCLFADDTGIFQPAQAFMDWLETRTAEDGSNLGSSLAQAFQVLNTSHDKRQSALDEQLAAFPYVNGLLFEENLPIAAFDTKMRNALLDACALDWSQISPAVFGAMFQSIMDKDARRNLGAHYTSEQNIEKLIRPLFLDELYAEFNKVKKNRNRLFEFQKKLRSLTFLDPACGCGNFLVVTYKALRELELDVLRAALAFEREGGQMLTDVMMHIQIDVDQFYGIEIEEFPARIAEVALWLTDHQMNLKVSEAFGMYFARIPLKSSPHIHHGNALRMDWEDVVPKERLNYILGNPPFVGYSLQSSEQKSDMLEVCFGAHGSGVLDLVAGWYFKAAELMSRHSGESWNPDNDIKKLAPGVSRDDRSHIRCAFVSTNSITQGEQPGVLWPPLLSKGLKIHFGHRTFRWSNEASGKAAVHCVIIGFGMGERPTKVIYDYADVRGEPLARVVNQINPYLVDGPNIIIQKRRTPISPVAPLVKGSQPTDGGNLLLNDDQKQLLLKHEPSAENWIRPFVSAKEFLRGESRWCLWLEDVSPRELQRLPLVLERINAVREFRLQSKKKQTRELANRPTLFAERRQPSTSYLLVPRHTSENRAVIPIGVFPPSHILADSCSGVENATPYSFGVLSSSMHMAWVKIVCGRIKSDFRYTNTIVYNNFPWPQNISDARRKAIETAAQTVLDTREQYPDSTLADLYDPLTMPPDLLKAHRKLDAAVDAAYTRKKFSGDADRVAFLFDLYQQITSLLPKETAKKKRKARTKKTDG